MTPEELKAAQDAADKAKADADAAKAVADKAAADAAALIAGTATVSQAQLDAATAQAATAASAEARATLLAEFGVSSVEELATTIAAATAANEANMSDAEKAKAAADKTLADAEKIKAEALKAQADAAEVTRQAHIRAAAQAAQATDPDLIVRLVDVPADAEPAVIAAAVETLKASHPALFTGTGPATPDGTSRPAGADSSAGLSILEQGKEIYDKVAGAADPIKF